jgi:hypothetical protein
LVKKYCGQVIDHSKIFFSIAFIAYFFAFLFILTKPFFFTPERCPFFVFEHPLTLPVIFRRKFLANSLEVENMPRFVLQLNGMGLPITTP